MILKERQKTRSTKILFRVWLNATGCYILFQRKLKECVYGKIIMYL